MLRHIPNIITVFRIIIILPLILMLSKSYYWEAMLLFFIAGLSDGIDGFLAKQFKWQSRLGAILDPIADKLLLVITMLMLCVNQKISWWLFSAAAIRDIIIVIGAYAYHRALGPYDMAPSRLSKLNTFLQILLLVSILVSLSGITVNDISIPEWYLSGLTVSVYMSILLSCFHYIYVWGGRYFRNRDYL